MLGEHIRKLRKEKKLTLAQLGAVTELSSGYISQIERGLTEPSLYSLHKIADALDVPAMLLISSAPSDDIFFKPRNKQPLVSIPESDAVQYRICSILPSNEFMPSSLLLEFTIRPHMQDFPYPIHHNTEELIVLTAGEATVIRMGEPVRMQPGDTLIIQKNISHLIKNEGDTILTGYSIMTPAIWSLES